MKTFLKWTLFVLFTVAAIAAGTYCLAQYFNSQSPSSDEEEKSQTGKAIAKSFNRHYTKLNLS